MVGGRARARSPRELTDNPEAWPEKPSADVAAEAVRLIARTLTLVLNDQGLSLRTTAAGSGVNRQVIADLLAGRSWPDVATVARLAHFTGATLWPPGTNIDRKRTH
ncbi:helix-turn-helix domain-containing protein [Streptomyces scopuliridis]|uniref:helix-turn-helix domain-containing protein n=1 Tax=Streptomyces scopuliridis TaxID=452529 RepID=UPI002DDB35E8|nr:helix-turn-helix transcriptional regulator [Streptomyces scopuliridis]WSB35338.1 helix-turn-helix domain-containing protein [Streptomyces scopuliridis]